MHESQPQYVTSEGVGFGVGALVGTAVVGLPLGDCDGRFVGEDVGLFGLELFVGSAVPPLTQIPLTQVPNGMELQGVESDRNCGEGQL